MPKSTKYVMRGVGCLTGVSTSAVSAAINNTDTMSRARTMREQDWVAALSNDPDEDAHSLKTGTNQRDRRGDSARGRSRFRIS